MFIKYIPKYYIHILKTNMLINSKLFRFHILTTVLCTKRLFSPFYICNCPSCTNEYTRRRWFHTFLAVFSSKNLHSRIQLLRFIRYFDCNLFLFHVSSSTSPTLTQFILNFDKTVSWYAKFSNFWFRFRLSAIDVSAVFSSKN